MTALQQHQARAQHLRIVLLHQWKDIRVQLANLNDKTTQAARALNEQAEALKLVLQRDNQLFAAAIEQEMREQIEEAD